jgi:hypothetical protein
MTDEGVVNYKPVPVPAFLRAMATVFLAMGGGFCAGWLVFSMPEDIVLRTALVLGLAAGQIGGMALSFSRAEDNAGVTISKGQADETKP